VLLKHSRGIELAMEKTSVTLAFVGTLAARLSAIAFSIVLFLVLRALAMLRLSDDEKLFS